MKIECPWCHKFAGAYVPKGGDGSALRLRSHKNLWGGKCMGSGMLDTQGRDSKSGAGEHISQQPLNKTAECSGS